MTSSTQTKALVAALGSYGGAYSAAKSMLKKEASHTKVLNVIGPTPPIPKQKRNAPCGCGSGVKAKKCCGIYPKQRTAQ